MPPEGFGMGDITALPSWMQYLISARSLLMAFEHEDPEDTLMVQLTTPELGLTVLGLLVMQRMFPEFQGACGTLAVKLTELARAQEFFILPEGEESTEGEE